MNKFQKELVEELDFETLKLINNTYIDDEYKEKICDLVFEIRNKRGDETYLLDLEHQSTNDKEIESRILNYNRSIREKHCKKKDSTNDFSTVLNILIYAGKTKYTGHTEIQGSFDDSELEYKEQYRILEVIDLHKAKIETIINKYRKASLAFIALKHGIKGDYLELLTKYKSMMKKLIRESTYSNLVLKHIYQTTKKIRKNIIFI